MDKNKLPGKIKQYLQLTLDKTAFERVNALVKTVRKIAENYTLNDEESAVIQSAAWFDKRPDLALKFLQEEKVNQQLADQINHLISFGDVPSELTEMIFSDAVTASFGERGFKKRMEEDTARKGQTKQEWLTGMIATLSAHHYYTDYALQKLENNKKENLAKMGSLLKANETALKKERPERAVEMMFKISASNHQHLSSMADNKAHILITVNSIILSILISVLLRRLDEDSYLAYPTFILLTVSLVSIIIAIIAIKPVVRDGVSHAGGFEESKQNLLFFGNVSVMKLKDFTDRILSAIDDKDKIYLMLIRNAYLHSVVLGRKSRLLKIAYHIFMYGLIISVVAFIVVSAVHTPESPAALLHTLAAPIHLKTK
jgi:Family of unknown function (DUF5706)